MKIETPVKNIPIAWEGLLASYNNALPQDMGVSAAIGEPFRWSEKELMGEKWRPSILGHHYYLLQFAFTLTPRKNLTIASADFCLSLGSHGGKHGIVVDAYPREQIFETNKPVVIGIGPDFKLRTDEGSLANAETTIDFGYISPIVLVEGLGDARTCWRFTSHSKHPLTGSRKMLAIVSLPFSIKTTLATISLSVTVEGRFGPIRVSPPETESKKFRFIVGETKIVSQLNGDSTTDAPPPEEKKERKGK